MANKKGRQSKYDKNLHPTLVRWMVRSGLTDEEIAQELGIHHSTLYRWKDKHPEFRKAFDETKPFIDALVEDALLKRALGYIRVCPRPIRSAASRSDKISFWLILSLSFLPSYHLQDRDPLVLHLKFSLV